MLNFLSGGFAWNYCTQYGTIREIEELHVTRYILKIRSLSIVNINNTKLRVHQEFLLQHFLVKKVSISYLSQQSFIFSFSIKLIQMSGMRYSVAGNYIKIVNTQSRSLNKIGRKNEFVIADISLIICPAVRLIKYFARTPCKVALKASRNCQPVAKFLT